MEENSNTTTTKIVCKQGQALKIIASIFVGLFASVSIYVFHSLKYYDEKLYTNTGNSIFLAVKAACSGLKAHPKTALLVVAIFLAVGIVFYLYLRHKNTINKFVFKHRYIIALVVLALCVIFDLNGSSIGVWAQTLPYGNNSGLILGTPRGCRTDEYALFTGLTFAQYYDPQGSWPYFGEVLRATSTDMFMVHGQAVLDPAIIFRPYQIPFLVLGLSRGISFFWFSRAIALFMTSFELCRIITKDKRAISLAFACLMALAPVVSWWFALNNFVEMLVFFNLIIVCLNAYTKVNSALKRRLLIVAIAYCCVGFLFSVYPAWQVPLFYVLLALIVPIIYENKTAFARALKTDWQVVALCAVVAICASVAIAYHSIDMITAEMNTDYPGSRSDVGGGGFLVFFRFPVSLFLSFVPASAAAGLASGLPDNMTTFFDFCPLGIILAIVNIVREKKVNPTTLGLMIVIVFLGLYCAVGFPEILAKVTLMGKSMTSRAIVIFSLANLILLFHEVARFKPFAVVPAKTSVTQAQSGELRARVAAIAAQANTSAPQAHSSNATRSRQTFTLLNIAIVCVCVVVCLGLCALCKAYEVSFVGKAKFVIIFAMLLCVWLAVAFGKQRAFASVCVAVAIISGAFVNPIQKGIDCIDQNAVITEVRSVAQENQGAKWVAAVGWKTNIMLFAGAPTINTTNLYPNADLWAVLDPNNERKSDWNRCTHIHSKIVSEALGSSFEKKDIYLLQVNFTLSDLRKLGVEFVTAEDGQMELTDSEMSQLELISTVGTFKIYRIK